MNTTLRDLHPKGISQEQRIRQLEDDLNTLRQRMALKYDTIIIHYHGIKRIVPFHQVVMLQSQGNYTYIFLCSGEKLLTSKTLKHWQTNISSPDFIRTHNSFMINKYHLKQIDYKKRSLLLESGVWLRFQEVWEMIYSNFNIRNMKQNIHPCYSLTN